MLRVRLSVLLIVLLDVFGVLGRPCNSNVCFNGGSCVIDDSGRVFQCLCPSGFTGTLCESGVLPCTLDCGANGKCVNDGEEKCECAPGFSGQFCADKDESCLTNACPRGQICLDDGEFAKCVDDPCNENQCANNSTCVSGKDFSYQCECSLGFTGKFCEDDLDECEFSPCKNGASCVNTSPGFHCQCTPSFTGDLCQKPAGFCARKPCQNGGECVEQLTGYRCQCGPEWTGRDCDTPVPKCRCENPRHECTLVRGRPECRCPEGFEGADCGKRIDVCEKVNNCRNGGQCIGNSNSSSCICPSNFSGEFCEIPLGECLVEGRKCENGGICRRNLVGEVCECPRAFNGKWCEKQRFSALGTTKPDLCPKGYCFNNGTCSAGIGSLHCSCQPGFTGSRCESPVDPCYNHLCENGATCIPGDENSYSCRCREGFVGSFCELTCDCAEHQECAVNSAKDGVLCITVASSSPPPTTSTATTTTSAPEVTEAPTTVPPTTVVTATTTARIVTQQSTNTPVVVPLEDLYNVTSCDACVGAERCLQLDTRRFCVCPKNKDGKFCEKPLEVCASLNCTRFQECRVERTSRDVVAKCACPPGFTGEKCDQATTVTFTQNSLYLHQSKNIFIGSPSHSAAYSVDFSFRTTAPNVLFVAGETILGQKQFFLGLSAGRLEMNVSSQTFSELLDFSLNDGLWYRILLNKTSEGTVLRVFEEHGYLLAERSFGVQQWEVFSTRFGMTDAGFMVGCLRDIRVDGDDVDPTDSARSVDVRPGCERRVQCEADTCQNGARCVDLWTDFRCECRRPFLPPYCINKLEEFTFGHRNESSLLSLKLRTEETAALKQRTDVSFLLRTNARDGSIVYLGEKGDDVATFVSLELINGRIVAKSRLGGKRIMETEGGAVVNDNKAHLIELRRYNNNLKVFVDEKEDSQFTIDRPFNHPLLADQVLLGSDENGNSRFLKGSLQDVRVNDKNVLLQENRPSFQVEPFGQVLSRKNLLKGTISDDVCADVIPCMHGTCQNTFNDYECQCNRGWMGRNCEVKDFCVDHQCPEYATCLNTHGGFVCKSTATFYQSSFIKYKIAMPSSPAMARNYNMSFSVRTRTTDGHLLRLQSSSETLSLSFADRNLVVVYSNQSDTVQDEMNHLIIDGDWHTVTLAEDPDSQRLVVSIDEEEFRSTARSSFSLKHFVMDRNAVVSVGRTYNASGFEGCLRDLQISQLPEFSFLSRAKFGGHLDATIHFAPEARENVVEAGCESTAQCGRIDPCKNGASCRDLFNLRKCECLPGFEGDLCEVNVDECALLGLDACGSHGVCIDSIGTHSCRCEKGFNGTRCDQPVDMCTSNPCENNAKCSSVGGKAVCQCDEPFVGSRCQQRKTANCSVNPCENQSECLDLSESSFSCQCRDGFEGLLCGVPIDNCVGNACQHGALCISNGTSYSCECATGFEGEFCENPVDTCGRLSPCVHGTCKNVWNGFLCECAPGYEGARCDVSVDECARFPCMNNATCSNVAGGHRCDCQKFYLGEQCEVAGICASAPCVHGECVQHSATEHSCECSRGFTGVFCEEQIDFCRNDPCENGATCIKEIGAFRCACIPGFSGDTCGIDIDECAAKPCRNGGECIDRVNGFECRCNGTGFRGPVCQEDIDECLQEPDSCQHGRCSNSPGSYHCECEDGFIGRRCNVVNPCLPDALNRTLHNCVHGDCARPSVLTLDSGRDVAEHECDCLEGFSGPQCTHMVEKRRSITLSYIVGPVVSIFVVLCLLGCALFCFVARGKGATQGTYSPSNQEMTGARMHPMTTMIKQPPEERLI
ncbi:hypothetical protein QR680_016845 [Steinernema hermaphroditum]|uniref:Protein crumbs n=1 Tax=Steinernema hermaphroditum TaxID=289476 RepID=A0AA39HCG1_9BILA|nr:hypothetical protein QR680_016845 [Steinernema hermaphroditum]